MKTPPRYDRPVVVAPSFPVLALVALAACSGGDGGTGPTPDDDGLGAVRIVVETAGAPGDPDGVTVAIEGAGTRTVAAGAEVLVEDVPPGSYPVAVSGVADGCSLERGPTREVGVSRGSEARLALAVLCGDSQTILFYDWPSGVYSIRPDGSNLFRVSSQLFMAEWSPDRTRIAGLGDLGLMVGPLGEPLDEPLISRDQGTQSLSSFAWAPDSRRIAYSWAEDGSRSIRVVDVETGEVTTVVSDGSSPSWSPDGTRLVFRRSDDEDEGSNLWIVPVDGGDPTQLTDSPGYIDYIPRWSPDGTLIAFNRSTAGAPAPRAHAIRLADGVISPLFPAEFPLVDLDWSPTGEWLVGVLEFVSQSADLAVATPDGGTITPIRSGDFEHPRW